MDGDGGNFEEQHLSGLMTTAVLLDQVEIPNTGYVAQDADINATNFVLTMGTLFRTTRKTTTQPFAGVCHLARLIKPSWSNGSMMQCKFVVTCSSGDTVGT